MPHFVNKIPRPIPQTFNEGSSQRPLTDSDAVARQWIKNKEVSEQIKWLTIAVKELQRELNRLRLRKGGDTVGGGSTPGPCPFA